MTLRYRDASCWDVLTKPQLSIMPLLLPTSQTEVLKALGCVASAKPAELAPLLHSTTERVEKMLRLLHGKGQVARKLSLREPGQTARCAFIYFVKETLQ